MIRASIAALAVVVAASSCAPGGTADTPAPVRTSQPADAAAAAGESTPAAGENESAAPRLGSISVGDAEAAAAPGSPGGDALVAVRDSDFAHFSRARAMRHVRRLANRIGVRLRATRGERLGARYFARKMRALGYRTKVQKFEADGETSRNVVAWWPGAMRRGFVIGGHIDSVAGSPGANDNASGIAVVLEAARIFAGTAKADLVRFAAFGSEEYGADGRHHVGSEVFVNRLGVRGRRRTPGMISVDMIADGRPLIVGTSGIGPEVVARTLHRKLDRAGFGVDYQTLCDCSDNGPFERAGIPAAFMWSGDEPDYHASSDTPGNLVEADLARTGRAVRRFMLALDRDMIRRFRRH